MLKTVRAVTSVGADRDSWGRNDATANYGGLKLGDRGPIAAAARRLAPMVEGVAEHCSDSEQVLITSSPRGIVPSASNLVARAVHSVMSDSGDRYDFVEVHRGRRAAPFPRHYAGLDRESRLKYLTDDCELWHIDLDLADRTVVVIDDVRVTGSQEDFMADFLSRRGVAHTHFHYLAVLSPRAGDVGRLESALNRVGVPDDAAFLDLVRRDDFTVTTRWIWRLLELGEESFGRTHDSLANRHLRTVLEGVRWEGVLSPLLSERVDRLESLLSSSTSEKVRHDS